MRPPIFATWLLTRFGVNESVIGDLVERFQRRPSSVWFWRQTLRTIVACLIREVRTHKLLTFRAVPTRLTGSVVFFVAHCAAVTLDGQRIPDLDGRAQRRRLANICVRVESLATPSTRSSPMGFGRMDNRAVPSSKRPDDGRRTHQLLVCVPAECDAARFSRWDHHHQCHGGRLPGDCHPQVPDVHRVDLDRWTRGCPTDSR